MQKKIFKSFFVLLVLMGLNFFFTRWVNSYITQIVLLCGINMIMAASLNLISGFTGQFSLGHAGFMAIGAYVSAAFSVFLGSYFDGFWGPIAFVFFILAGGLVAALFGFLIGLPSLRLRGDYLAIVTLGFGEIIRVILLNLDVVGGARGFTGIPESSNFFWIYLWVVITCFTLWKMVYSLKGKAFMAIRENEIAAQSIGIPPTRIKVTAFVIGAFFAGVGGGLFAHLITYLNPASFTFLKSIEVITMVVLGGLGSITGSLIAATVLTALPEFLREFSDYRMILYSLLLIIMMIARPQGLMGFREFKK